MWRPCLNAEYEASFMLTASASELTVGTCPEHPT